MKNFGQLWALVLATDRTEHEANSLLGYVVKRAARTTHRERVWAVVTQQHRRQLKGPLWFLPASNFIVLPEPASTTFGIVMGLLRILQRDPAARIVVLPASHDVRNEKPLMRSLRTAAAQTIVRPDDLFVLGVEPDAQDQDFPGIVVGRDDRRGAFEVEQLIENSSATSPHAAPERRLLWNTGILTGSAWALLRLIGLRVPDVVAQVQAVVRGTNPEAEVELNARLLGVDFHRHVLPGHERYLSVLPVPRCGWSDVTASERSTAQLRSVENSQADARIRGATKVPPPLFSWSALDQELQ
jgi:mannose-1-phosphate guanylyltransferase